VLPQPPDELLGVGLRTLQPDVQGAQPTQRQPGLEGPRRRADHVATLLEHVVQLVVGGGESAHQDVAVPGDELRRGVHHHVGAQRERLLQQRGGKGVVDDDVRAGLVRRVRDRRDVGHLQRGVGRRLQPDQRRVVAGLDHRVGVGDVDELRTRAAAGLEVGQLQEAAVVGVPRRHHHRAVADQVQDRRDHREPGGEGQAAATLQLAQGLLERRPRRVAVAAVLHLAARHERRGHRQGLVERVVRLVRWPTGGDGHGGGAVRRAAGLRVGRHGAQPRCRGTGVRDRELTLRGC
jgi:hypothetical protein